MATLLLGIGLGIGIGYGLGRWQGQAAGETARLSTGQKQQSAGNTTGSSHNSTQRNASEAPEVLARRLIDAMLHDKQGREKNYVERVQFQQAIAQCDEAQLSALIEEMRQIIKRDSIMVSMNFPEAEAYAHIMIERMATLEPMKALEALLVFEHEHHLSFRPYISEDLELIFANLSQQVSGKIPDALAKMEAIGIKSYGVRAWMITQAKTDPEAVFQYLVAGQDKAPMNQYDFKEIAKRLGYYAPEKALAAIRQRESTLDLKGLLSDVMLDWLHRAPSAARYYAWAQRDAEMLLPCLGDFFIGDCSQLREIFPELKASSSEARLTLASQLALNLAEQDVNAARQWAATLPPAEQAKANESIAYEWIDKDPVAASEWLATWPEGEDKEFAIDSLIRKIQEDDPERALTWATKCLQGQARYTSLAGIMESFAIKDPNAAAAARAALSEEDRTLLNFIEKNPYRNPFAPSP